MKKVYLAAVALLTVTLLGSCDSTDSSLAEYEGDRPFIILRVTSSFSPDLQWVGGRAAAVGINKGTKAALDSTLIWLAMDPNGALDSPLRIREQNDVDRIVGYGGTPQDSLDSDETYTFWIADKASMDAGLTGEMDEFSFVDSTFRAAYALRGRSGGDPALDVEFKIVRDQTLADDKYLVFWEPSTVAFRQVALRRSGTGGFTNLLWHVVQEGSGPESFHPPLVIGEAPPGGQLVVQWPEEGGFTPPATNYTLWLTQNHWTGEFSSSTPGYAFFQIFSTNF